MRIHAFRRTTAILFLGLLPLLAVASCGEEAKAKKHFPGAFPGTHTDVSAAQAFRDFDLDVPTSAKVVGYYAWSADERYPMAAVLRMPCSAMPGFVSGSKLRTTSFMDGATVSGRVFVGEHGWATNGKDEFYVRDSDGVSVVTHQTGTECRVYVDA
ncbi:hypothetical protein [Streptomyces sp. NPDC048106]|uniref:hypothetical protein n=1 Tax=Streptomyces sp. NPDC048106 TaxID=3155750 RepID=UPI00345333B0